MSYELFYREIEKKEIPEEELILPSLKHVEQEGKPEEKKKYKPDAKGIEEPSEYEIVFKRRQSQVTDLAKNKDLFSKFKMKVDTPRINRILLIKAL